MIELDLLCKLEKHNNSLNTNIKKLEELSQDKITIKIKKNIKTIEKEISQLEKREEYLELELRKLKQKLKGDNYKLEEISNSLYSGESKDINQLENWSTEKESISIIINNDETIALEFMEELDQIKDKLAKAKEYFFDLKKKFKINNLEKEEKEFILKEEIKNHTEDRIKIENQIDKNLLTRYNLIRKNKGTALAQVNNNICSGCNISISIYISEKLKNDKEIAYCELCGRILCKDLH